MIVIACFLLQGSNDNPNSSLMAEQYAKQRGIKTESENRTIFKDA